MAAIFYDLETSDREPIGQILNYAFILVDDELATQAKLSGQVRLSRLQLPSAEAILVNRVNVLELQRTAESEQVAARKIVEFIRDSCNRCGERVALIGFNSGRFDLTYLRTTLIRNGYNPYFGGRLAYRDILHGVRKLAALDDRFPRPGETKVSDQAPRLSLRLESVARALGVLDGDQKHDAEFDTDLSIRLAHELKSRFGLDVVKLNSFEVAEFAEPRCAGTCVWLVEPEYDLSLGRRARQERAALLTTDSRSSLWINLERYGNGEGRGSIRWYSHQKDQFISLGRVSNEELIEKHPAGASYRELLDRAREEFRSLTVNNFFSGSTCDIEQDIYREMDVRAIEVLAEAIHGGNLAAARAYAVRGPWILYLRHCMAVHNWDGEFPDRLTSPTDQRICDWFIAYAHYRYSGQAQLAKQLPSNRSEQELRADTRLFHPTFEIMRSAVDHFLSGETNSADETLLRALREYYDNSEIAVALRRVTKSTSSSSRKIKMDPNRPIDQRAG